MFYNHGGGYVIGSGGSAGQEGANLARYFDVVVVQTNHRLGLFGFLYLDALAGQDYAGSGNTGLLDILEGLKCVKENIAQLGGDPENVMIFGESGGGAKTACLYSMASAAPYFAKAFIESGPGVRMTTTETAEKVTAAVLKELGIAPHSWRKLLEVPAATLLALQSKYTFVPPYIEKQQHGTHLGFGPVVDGVVVPHHPFDPTAPDVAKQKPLLVGWNEDEYTFFAWERKQTDFATLNFETLQQKLAPVYGTHTPQLLQAYRTAQPQATAAEIFMAISSIAMMGIGSIEIAEQKARQQGAPVYLYNFGYKSEKLIPGTDYPMGTPHAMDITFKFNNERAPEDGSTAKESFFGGNRSERFQASHNFAALWTAFAKTSIPSVHGLPQWPAYNLSTRATMRIAEQCTVINNRYSTELAAWREMGWL